jgi:hypothetical protein
VVVVTYRRTVLVECLLRFIHPTEKVKLLYQLVQRELAFPQPGYEAVEGREVPHEPLNVFDISNLAYFGDG